MQAGADAEPRRGSAGYSLVEVVVTVALLGIVVVPVLAAVRGSIAASAVTRAAAQVETALVNAAEAVNRAPLSCDAEAYAHAVDSLLVDLPGEATLGGLDVAYATGPTDWSPPGQACPTPAPAFDLVQLVTIAVESGDGGIRRSVSVVKTHV